MEVASPLTMSHTAAGTKRSLACSPGLVESTNLGPFASNMELSDDTIPQRAFKRRRFQDATMDMGPENTSTFPSFMSASIQHSKYTLPGHAQSFKRCRQDALSPGSQPNDLQRVVEEQASEIEYLKTAKNNLESSLASLRSEHEKTQHENKILKRAVTIQQERQTHAANDLQSARDYKVNAEDKIRRLEQMILSLRYHLQAQQPHNGNDFMGFPPQPPDVY